MTTFTGTGMSRWTPAAMPPRSAAIVAMFAVTRTAIDASSQGRPNRSSMTWPRPSSLTAPIRADMDCTATSSGIVNTAIHSSP